MAAPAPGEVVPAQLGFLAIFNPSLGNTDETVDDQIVYYASSSTQRDGQNSRRARSSTRPTDNISREERNERLRQIGLAQGMASFSRGFASGAAVDAIETDKSRVVLHELEPGWWILASIDLTKMPVPPRLPVKNAESQEDGYEYSGREMKPAALVLKDLLRAHGIFLMHHDSSLSALFVRSRRSRFVAVLSRYWDLFLSTWSVVLHGNPVKDVFGGINIAASGELGVGVGEEESGSGERDVLEGFAGRIEGLVDLVVSKFGDDDPDTNDQTSRTRPEPWLGTGQAPRTEDGAIFLGNGVLSRKSLRDITHWMEDLYTWGDHAYGVIDSPTSTRRHKFRGAAKVAKQGEAKEGDAETTQAPNDVETPAEAGTTKENQEGKLDHMVSYLKLGYGSYWTLPGTSSAEEAPGGTSPKPAAPGTSEPTVDARPGFSNRTSSFEAAGHYLIGLKGEIEEAASEHDLSHDTEDSDSQHNNSRTVLRTIHVELESESKDRPEATIVRDFEHPASVLVQSQVVGSMTPGYDSHDLNKAKKLRVVVYVNKPFMFAFLFELRTDSLAWDTLYRSLHYQLAPLKKPLLASTGYRPQRPQGASVPSGIHDLVWDPANMTVHSTIPNIPDFYEPADTWSRADALNTHLHLLNIFSATRARTGDLQTGDLERTQKTSRGWWIVWTRLQEAQDEKESALSPIQENRSETGASSPRRRSSGGEPEESTPSKEIMLVRRASDHVGFHNDGGADVGRVAQGIGIDTRRYIEELLTLL